MSEFKNLKIEVKNKSEAKAVQEKLFALGYRWRFTKDEIRAFDSYPSFIFSYDSGVYFEKGSNSEEYFSSHPNTLITVDELLNERPTWKDVMTHEAMEGASVSDGSTASYYELPEGATELQHLISHRDMNAQVGEIFRACYRYGLVSHSPKIRDIKKIIFYAQAELDRLEKLEK